MAAASSNFVERELTYFRSATAFRELSTIAAMDLCRQERMPAPEWLVKDATELLFTLVRSQKVSKRGRAGGYIAEYRRHLNDLDRWDAVQQVREHRNKTQHNLKIVREDPRLALRAKGVVKHFTMLKRWLRYGTFQCAALLVAHSGGLRVTAEAVRRSYRRIEKKNATKGFRSCTFMPDFLQKLGISEQKKSGTKWRPITDLAR